MTKSCTVTDKTNYAMCLVMQLSAFGKEPAIGLALVRICKRKEKIIYDNLKEKIIYDNLWLIGFIRGY